MKNHAEELAAAIRTAKTWDMAQLAELCSFAGMEQEWASAGGENFEAVAVAAADKLGVELFEDREIEVLEVITISGWVDGSGWSYEQNYSDNTIIIRMSALSADDIDWSWWETDEDAPENEDTYISVKYYALDADIDEDRPLAEWSAWASAIGENDDTEEEGE